MTSEREGGDVKDVDLRSNLGNLATVVNPWGTAAVVVREIGTTAPLLSSSSATLSFGTKAGGVYVVRHAPQRNQQSQ